MAEYFPLLDRAISGLTEPTAEARRSIYERARTALIGQLRRMDPPIPEEDIARESTALDEAIARVEARFDDHGQGAAPLDVAVADAVPAPPPPVPAASPKIPAPSLPTGTPPVVQPPSRERPVLAPRPAAGFPGPAAPVVAPARPAAVLARAPLPPRGTRPVMALRPVVPASDPTVPGPTAAAPPEAGSPTPTTQATEASQAEEAGTADAARPAPSFADALDEAGRPDPDAAADLPPAARSRDSALRPPAPRPREARGWGRAAIVASCAVVALAMAGIGFTAYRLRDRPEQVVAARTSEPGGTDAAARGKAADRAADAVADNGTAEPATSGAAVPAPVPSGTDAGAGGPAIAVAQRAALLVDAPDDPQRVKTYVGSVVWHLDSVNPGGNQPLASAVKAEVDIPEAKLKVTMLMQKNPEPQLPASHTIEFHFLPQPGNTLGPVKQINVPEMRRDDDAPTGDPLTGVPVAITDNYFLVGLSRGAAEGQNTRLLAERNWFDMGVLFTSGKLGKLTFEKGAAGRRVIEDALRAWK